MSDTSSELMPALFIGHGSPMNTLERNRYTDGWRALGESLPRPRAILCVSAHWYFGATAVTAMPRPRTIHDFYGFPQQLFDFEYPAPGLPELAEEVSEVVKPHWVGADLDQWGIDHGTWSVLAHLFPMADIPVVQLSINALKPLDYHIELGAKLAELRKRGVLILGSGNVVHNLGALRRDKMEEGEHWAHRFDDAAAGLMENEPEDIMLLKDHPDYRHAVPTPDHFIPLLYIAGLAAAEAEKPKAFLRGYSMGSLSMTCYSLCAKPVSVSDTKASAGVPSDIPADQTNI